MRPPSRWSCSSSPSSSSLPSTGSSAGRRAGFQSGEGGIMTMQIADSVSLSAPDAKARAHAAAARNNLRTEPRAVRITIITLAILFLSVFVVLPLVVVFAQAFSKGVLAYLAALAEPEALSAIKLTLLVAAISVGLNLVFGLV